MTERSLFSETWHRVAPQHIRLRPSVRVRKQFFRGETWYVANDSYGDQFFRFRPEAWDFIGRLDGTRTVEEIWRSCLERNQDRAPGQGEVVQMLSQLYQANFIVSDVPADVVQLFERKKKRRAREWKANLIGIFFLRMRLWDPDSFLTRALPFVRPFMGKVGALLWLALIGGALSALVGSWDKLAAQANGVLAPGNLLLLYLSFAAAKLVHEFGHGFAVKRFGGEVHAMGITLLVFTPVPYVDATAAWAFRERWKRVWVGSAGMIVEMALAALAAFVWVGTGPGTVNAIAYNLMIVASVSTVLFNINPLLRFDGYYILSDLTDSPNLQPRSMRMLQHLTERYAFGGRFSQSPARSTGDAVWLALFGAASWVYRVYITYRIVMFVADKYFGLGLLAGIISVGGLFVVPLVKGGQYLFSEPRIERVRGRAWAVTAATLAVLVVLLGVIPAPRHFRAHGVLRAEDAAFVLSRARGYVTQFESDSEHLNPGDVIVRLESPELLLSITEAQAELQQLAALERHYLKEDPSGLAVLHERRRVTEAHLAELEAEREGLVVRADREGRWSSPDSLDITGRWFPRGAFFGEIVPSGGWEFHAVVSQDDAGSAFDPSSLGREGEVRLVGSAGQSIHARALRLVPGRQDMLPSAALGWAGGGPIQVQPDDNTGRRAVEPFFLIVAQLDAGAPELWHGRTGQLRLELPPEPLLFQWMRDLRQLLQRRFQI